MERDAALADFGEARREWEEAFARVPDDALRYLKPGDDYALGGLQVHVNWVLARYLRVLESGTVAQPPPSAEGLRRGLSPAERRQSLAEMSRLHEAVKTRVDRLAESDWSRKSPVVYGPGENPYPTSPEDVVGWLCDHYREHVVQCADLVEEWRTAKPGG